MTRSDPPASMPQWMMTTGIITFSLVSGVVLFAVILIAVIRSGKLLDADPWSPSGMLTLIGLAMAVAMAVLAYILPPLMAKNAIAQVPKEALTRESPGFEGWGGGARELLPSLMASQIIRLALLEGAAFFNLIAYMQEGKALSLIAAGVLLLLMISSYLTETKVRDWLDRARELHGTSS